jgi:RNA polymerase sigma-70 factor, ECF subfamily
VTMSPRPPERDEARYEALKQIASRSLRNRPINRVLSTTSLVHEAFLKVQPTRKPFSQDDKAFFALMSYAVRSVIVDKIRRQIRWTEIFEHMSRTPTLRFLGIEWDQESIDKLEGALSRLQQENPHVSSVIHVHFFGGLTFREIASNMEVSEKTVSRLWQYGKRWLRIEVGKNES